MLSNKFIIFTYYSFVIQGSAITPVDAPLIIHTLVSGSISITGVIPSLPSVPKAFTSVLTPFIYQ